VAGRTTDRIRAGGTMNADALFVHTGNISNDRLKVFVRMRSPKRLMVRRLAAEACDTGPSFSGHRRAWLSEDEIAP
jgi:hypothetical protein